MRLWATIIGVSILHVGRAVASQPVSIVIARVEKTALTAAPTISVSLANAGTQLLTIPISRFAPLDYVVRVVAANGVEVLKTSQGAYMSGDMSRVSRLSASQAPPLLQYNVETLRLKPGQRVVEYLRLDDLYQLSPGDYVVSVRSSYRSVDKAEVVRSNSVRFRVN